MDRRLLVRGELLHRRGAPDALRAGLELAEDLLVRVTLADAGLELLECLRVDPRDRSIGAAPRHGNQNRAYLKKRKTSLCSLTVEARPRLRGDMRLELEVALARGVGRLSRLARAGGGTTLPGKLLAVVDRDAVGALAARLPNGCALVSATNGKTTTCALAASILAPRTRLAR